MFTFVTRSQINNLRYGHSLRFGGENLWHTQQSSDSMYWLSTSVSDKITSTAFFGIDIPLEESFGLNATLLSMDFWVFGFINFDFLGCTEFELLMACN